MADREAMGSGRKRCRAATGTEDLPPTRWWVGRGREREAGLGGLRLPEVLDEQSCHGGRVVVVNPV
jgi:hypothetical protein